jgi:hypothetical protein
VICSNPIAAKSIMSPEPSKSDAPMLVSTARIDEPQAMAAFLASIPDSEELAALLGTKEALNTRAYEDESQTARFVISDGTTVTCFTVTDITIDQAELITIECEKSDAWSDTAFREAAVRALRP